LWVRAPPNPSILFELKNPRSRSGSHSAGDGAQFLDHVHTIVCCSLLLFFWVTLADLTLLTDVWCTSQYFMTLSASSRSCHRRKGRHRAAVATRLATDIGCVRATRSRWQSATGHKFLYNELRTVVSIDDGKIIFDKGEIVRNGAPLHRRQGNTVSLLAGWDRHHHWSEGARFLGRVLRPAGNVSQGRWKRHQSLESDTHWRPG
jgi:hypothetical protein